MSQGDEVHGVVRRIDGTMATFSRVLHRFGTPGEVRDDVRAVKRAVGDVIAELEMVQRRSEH